MWNRIVIALALVVSSNAYSQPVDQHYKKKFDDFKMATQSMIGDFANATLDSACLTKANFDKVTANFDPESKAAAVRFRSSGIETLNKTSAWETCKSQSEHISLLATAISSASASNAARELAKISAFLDVGEDIDLESGLLVDRVTKVPINSPAKSARSLDSSFLLAGTYGARGAFDATLTISQDGLVTACDVVMSIGNENADRAICRNTMRLMRYRPAFVGGKITQSTAPLRIHAD